MLYSWTGREIPSERDAQKMQAERLVAWEPVDRQELDASRALSPSKLDQMLRDANAGDPEAQARLALEIEEKDWDIAQALQTRRAAVLGLEWRCGPSIEDDARAMEISDAAEAMLGAINPRARDDVAVDDLTWESALEAMLSAILPGYACLEILWSPNGAGVDAFSLVRTSAITFRQSREPLIRTSLNAAGTPLAPRKFLFHRHRSRSGDATRGGLIRPLGWIFAFKGLGIKDLLRYTEKYGMPFIVARLEDTAWEKDRNRIAYVIRNFGSDGGGVFSKAVETELLQASAGGGELYFKLLDHFGDAITRVVLGQLATSGESTGFSRGGAQAAVRQDILESDCDSLAATIRRDVLVPWCEWNYGPDAPVPFVQFDYQPPEDLANLATMVAALAQAGYPVDPAEVEARFGVPLLKDAAGEYVIRAAAGTGAADAVAQHHLEYGIVTRNEVRRTLGLPATPGGDVPVSKPEAIAALRGDRNAYVLAENAAQKKTRATLSRTRSQRRFRW